MPTLDPNAQTHVLLLRFSGDISTKGSATRSQFTKRLVQNLAEALTANGIGYHIDRQWDRVLVRVDQPHAVDVVPRVFGVQSVSLVEEHPWSSLEDVIARGEQFFRESVTGKTFAIRCKRSKETTTIPFGSQEVAQGLGARLFPHSAGVDLRHPEVKARIDVHEHTALFFHETLPGNGGLPVGVGGRALSLVSGGFDSAVASWQMLRRGITLSYLFYNLGGQQHRDGVRRVMKVVADHWSYGHHPKLVELDFQPIVKSIQAVVAPRYWQVVLKRLMLRVAERAAERLQCSALITGDAVGQVSSQTLQNIAVISRATTLPILRPLVAFNKDEIIELARKIGTFDLSAQVDEYCALQGGQPSTSAKLSVIDAEEAKVDPEAIEAALDSWDVVSLRKLEVAETNPAFNVEEIPEGAVVVDLRSAPAYRSWHAEGAVHLEFSQAQRAYASFGKHQRYVLYCEIGLKSAHLAELMREAGIDAVHVRGGVRTLIRAEQTAAS